MIRIATLEDCEEITRVNIAAWKWAFAQALPPEMIAARSDVAARTERMRGSFSERAAIHVAEEDGRIVGFASESKRPQLEAFDAEIEGLYVHPDSARGGIGRTLVQTAVQGFLQRGARSLAIHTLAEAPIGRAFYERIGGRVHLYDQWNGFPAVWYAWDEPAMRAI